MRPRMSHKLEVKKIHIKSWTEAQKKIIFLSMFVGSDGGIDPSTSLTLGTIPKQFRLYCLRSTYVSFRGTLSEVIAQKSRRLGLFVSPP